MEDFALVLKIILAQQNVTYGNRMGRTLVPTRRSGPAKQLRNKINHTNFNRKY